MLNNLKKKYIIIEMYEVEEGLKYCVLIEEEELKEIEGNTKEKRFYAYCVINFIEQDFIYIFLKKFKKLFRNTFF